MRSPTAAGRGRAPRRRPRTRAWPRVLPGICAVAWAAPALMPAAIAQDGLGTMTVSPASVTASQVAALVFTYTAPAGQEVKSGTVTLTVPPGWTPPAPAPGPGEVSLSCPLHCTLGVPAGSMTITVSGLDLLPAESFTITYAQATAPGEAGSATFAAGEESFSDGTLTPLASSPAETVTALASSSASASPTGSASATPSGSASATSSASASASPSSSVTGSGGAGLGPTATPTSTATSTATETVANRSPLHVLIPAGLALLAAAVLAAATLAARLLRRGHGLPLPARLRAVPHAGPPAPVTVDDTGTGPAPTVRIEPHAGHSRPEVEEVRS